jgi:UDP-N-acetyl-D-glucosamine dehydrogenase
LIKVAVIGQGYVGLPIAINAAAAGYEVVGFDLNQEVVINLNSGKSHISDIPDLELKKFLDNKKYRASSDSKDLEDVAIAVIAVPTPLSKDRKPDLSFVESASGILGKTLKNPGLIINESTSYPGTLRNVIAPIVQSFASTGISHEFAISPERVDPGNENWSIKNTARLFAGLTPSATKKTRTFYEKFCDNLIEVSSPEVAETAKLFENTFRQVNIALVNELALITRDLGISVHETIDAAASKPYGFMKFSPGLGVGGHCIPVDPTYLSYVAEQAGRKANFINLANKVNLEMPAEIVKRIKNDNGGSLNGKEVLVCGVAYKPNISDVRETPSEILIEELAKEGAVVSWYDPLVASWKDSKSVVLGSKRYDATIIAMIHDVMDKKRILDTSDYVLDCTGKLEGAKKL